jgi:hypothetical protein
VTFLEAAARTACALVLVGATATASYSIATRLVPAAGLAARWTATGVVGMALATLGFHALAGWDLLRLPWALLACAGLVAVVAGPAGARAALRAALAREAAGLRRLARAFRRSPRRGWIVAFAVVTATVVLRPFVVPPLGYDSQVYHATKAALWVHEGGLRFLSGINTHLVFRNFPAGGEVFTAWGMLPYHDDFLAVAPEAIQWLLLVLAVIALARELGAREPYASAAGGLVGSLPAVRLLIGSGYVEPALAAAFAGGLVFLARALRRDEPGALVLAAAGLGVSAGVKLPMVALGVLGMALLLVAARRRRHFLAAAAVFLALASPWYLYNVLDTGLPLTPFPVEIAGVRLGEASWSFEQVGAVKSWLVRPFVWEAEHAALDKLFLTDATPHEAFGPWHLAILAGFLVALPFGVARRPRLFLPLAAIVGVAVAMIYGRDMATVRMVWPETFARFWIPAILVIAPVALWGASRLPRGGDVFLALVLILTFRDLLRFEHIYQIREDIVGQTRIAVAGLALWAILRRLPRRARLPAAAAAVILLTAWFHGWRARVRYDLLARSAVIGVSPRAWISLARVVDRPRQPLRIALTGAPMGRHPWHSYGVFGSRLQNDVIYVPPTASGVIVDEPQELLRRGDPRAWLRRLAASGADHVLVLQDGALELDWIGKLPRVFEPVRVEPGGRGVWRIVPEELARWSRGETMAP